MLVRIISDLMLALFDICSYYLRIAQNKWHDKFSQSEWRDTNFLHVIATEFSHVHPQDGSSEGPWRVHQFLPMLYAVGRCPVWDDWKEPQIVCCHYSGQARWPTFTPALIRLRDTNFLPCRAWALSMNWRNKIRGTKSAEIRISEYCRSTTNVDL